MSWEYVTLDKLGTISRGRSKHRPRNEHCSVVNIRLCRLQT